MSVAHTRVNLGRACLIITTALACLFLAPAMRGSAADSPEDVQLVIRPAGADAQYFDLTTEPGARIELAVELANAGTEPIEARTYVADAYTIPNGGLDYRLDGEPQSGTSLWVDYPAETLTLEPGVAVQRMFTVLVPEDAEPGEYLSGVVIQNATPIAGGEGGVSFNQVLRQAIAISLDIPGSRVAGLEIGAASHKVSGDHSALMFAVANTGNTRLKPTGTLQVWGPDDESVLSQTIVLDTFYANTSSSLEVSLPDLLEAGEYRAQLSLTDTAAGVSASSESATFLVEETERPVAVAPEPVPSGPTVTEAAVVSTGGGISVTVLIIISITGAIGGAAVMLLIARLRHSQGNGSDIPGPTPQTVVDPTATSASQTIPTAEVAEQPSMPGSLMRIERSPRPPTLRQN